MLGLAGAGVGVAVRICSSIVRAFAGVELLQGRMIGQLES
jgi:hypothetical protein